MAQRTRYMCDECKVPFMLAHEPSRQPSDLTPVGCPRCGHVLFADVPLDIAHALAFRALPEQVATQACNGCTRSFEVVFHAEPGEETSRVPVACPFCGWVNYSTIAASVLSDSMETPRYEARRPPAVGRRGSGRGRSA